MIHDSGNTFTKLSFPVSGVLAGSTNLYLGNNSGAAGAAPASVMYLDYIRITREIPEPSTIAICGIAAALFGAIGLRRRRQSVL